MGKPDAASRGETISWLKAITMIEPSRPAWVTPPTICPCCCPRSRRYALSAMIYSERDFLK